VDDTKRYASELKTEIDKLLEEKNEDGTQKYTVATACKEFLISSAKQAVATAYDEKISEKTKFIWVKNIWLPDSALSHPLMSDKDFENNVKLKPFDVGGKKVKFGDLEANGVYTDVYSVSTYGIVTDKLDTAKEEVNGYFIMIVLSVGTILLQQFVTMRAQKEQSQFSTVDGQGAQQQKMTMIIMTVMFAVFSFSYSTAFSIYMITSNITSLLSTLVINKLVDKAIEKKEAEALQAKYNNRFPGRKYDKDETKKK
jgi:membrane protein insertase Oxa1/YidC/SpoIIIJ